jgi:hypothetical protein
LASIDWYVAASTPPSPRAPRGRPSSGGTRANAGSKGPVRTPKKASGESRTSYRDDRPARPERRSGSGRPSDSRAPGARGESRGSSPSRFDRSSTRSDARPGTGAKRTPRTSDAARGSRDDDARGARPYRKGTDSSARRSGSRGGPARPSRYSRDREEAPLTPEQRQRQVAGDHAKRQGWGSVARKGAVNITSTGQELGDAKSKSRTPEPAPAWERVERPARSAAPAKAKTRAPYTLPTDVAANVRKAFIGTAYMREKMVNTLTRAAEAYDRKRYEEALRLGRIVADATPGVAAVRELTGLAAYRAERWAMAKIHLRAFFTISEDPEHLPLVMDADRANHRYRAVEKTFEEIQEHEPSAEVLAEARIVMAATWADQRRYDEAIELLTKAGAAKHLRNPSYRHVRLWYALADVYDRAGDTTSARELFARIVLAEPDAYDAKDRLSELGATQPRKNRKRRTTPTSKKKID